MQAINDGSGHGVIGFLRGLVPILIVLVFEFAAQILRFLGQVLTHFISFFGIEEIISSTCCGESEPFLVHEVEMILEKSRQNNRARMLKKAFAYVFAQLRLQKLLYQNILALDSDA